jgi:hypothetical protein
MTKTTALFFVLFLLLLGTAQRSDAQSQNRDRSAFAPEGEEFTVRNPESLSLYESDSSTQSRQYSGSFGNVRVHIVSDAINEKDGSYDRTLRLAVARKAKGVSTVLNGLKAQKFTFDDGDGASLELIAVQTTKRKYVFQTLSDRRSDPDSSRFFSNIIINTSRVNPPVPETVLPVDSKYPVYTLPQPRTGTGQGTGQGSGRGTGMGSGGDGLGRGIGSGSGTGSGDGSGPGDSTGNTGVKILSKPRPSLTDTARQNNVQGAVTLRVTFLASGTIGAIIPISGLPYGLTEQAIAAARSIRFRPAKRKGVPYTKSMLVQYNFSVY